MSLAFAAARRGACRPAAAAAAAAAEAEAPRRPFPVRDARLVLEDGSVWHGVGFGDLSRMRTAEVVFNTSLTGTNAASCVH